MSIKDLKVKENTKKKLTENIGEYNKTRLATNLPKMFHILI